MKNRAVLGDCKLLIPTLEDKSVNLVVTSPPYAMQRRRLYDGILEKEYPEWTRDWMSILRPKLAKDASVMIVIRPNLWKGVISDYVLKTRLALREDGWNECEELIWLKTDAPPMGSIMRPRRTWEKILWFSPSNRPYADLRALRNWSERLGFAGSTRFGTGGDSPVHDGQNDGMREGYSRCTDVFSAAVGTIDKGVMHPAMFPRMLAEQLIAVFSREGDLVLDPFVGSGQTMLAAQTLNRRCRGFDNNEAYVRMANDRLLAEFPSLRSADESLS